MKQDGAEVILADGTYIGPLSMLLDDDNVNEKTREDRHGT